MSEWSDPDYIGWDLIFLLLCIAALVFVAVQP